MERSHNENPWSLTLPVVVSGFASCGSLLRFCGIRITRPIAIICDNLTQQDALVSKMSIFSTNRIHIFSEGNFSMNVSAASDDVLFLTIDTSSQKDIQYIARAVADGHVNDWLPVDTTVCVLFIGFIPKIMQSYFSLVISSLEVWRFLESNIRGAYFGSRLASHEAKLMTLWTYLKSDTVKATAMQNETTYLLATVPILRFIFQADDDQAQKWHDAIMEKISESELNRDTSDLPDLFCRLLYQYAELLSPIAPLERKKTSSRQAKIFYDMNFYYFTTEAMNILLEKMKQVAGSTAIKQALADAEVLKRTGSSRIYMVNKVMIDGERRQCYVLCRDRLDRAGEETLVNRIEREGEKL